MRDDMNRFAAVIPIHAQIASRLRGEVYQGKLPEGAALREEELAARFGVSRSPIRQVLQQLTYEGLLLSRANCGAVVAAPPTAEVAQVLYDCRAKLECAALRECFHQLDESDFQRWRDLLSHLYGACAREDYGTACYYDILFHRVIVDKAGCGGVVGVFSAIVGATSHYVRATGRRAHHADLLEIYGMHAALLEMFRLGDVDIACEALSQHILRGEFARASCSCWTEAGKPRESAGVYDKLIPALRRAISRKAKVRKSRKTTRRRGAGKAAPSRS